MDLFQGITGVFVILLVFVMLRNSVVYTIRIRIINADISDASNNASVYEKLPSYDAMMLNPLQWHMWTVNQYVRKYK